MCKFKAKKVNIFTLPFLRINSKHFFQISLRKNLAQRKIRYLKIITGGKFFCNLILHLIF